MTEKNLGGRPLKFKSVEEIESKINEYFAECRTNNIPLTIEMLAWKLGTQRKTLLEYEDKDEFSNTIKSAKQFIYATKVENLNREKQNTAGIIFDLCNNGDGYTNKHQETQSGTNIFIAKDDGYVKFDTK